MLSQNARMRQGSTWTDQWYRILRWRERVRQSRDEIRTDSLGTEGYRDEVFAMCQAIWHLKDWFKNDPALDPSLGLSVERWINKHGNLLKVAADVANGSKHMSQNAGQQRASGSGQTRNDVSVFIGEGVRTTFYVEDARNGQDLEVVALADACLDEWRAFLKAWRLTEPVG
jgi:hypothetical protein